MMAGKYSPLYKGREEKSSFLFDYSSPFQYTSLVTEETSFNNRKYKSAFTYNTNLYTENEKEHCQDEGWLAHTLHSLIVFLCYFLVIIIFPISISFCLKKIHSLERMVIIRLGKLQPVKGPGLVIVLPCIDKWTRVDLRLRTFTVPSQQLLTADSAVVEIDAKVDFQVANVVSYVIRVHELENSVQQLGKTLLANLVCQKDQRDIETDQRLLQAEIQAELNRTVLSWGIEIHEITISPINVVKAAETTDAVSTLMSALKSALNVHPDSNTLFSSYEIDNATLPTSSSKPASTSAIHSCAIVSTIQHLANTAIKKGLFKGISPVFRLDITGSNPQVLHCCFNDGVAKVLEGSQDHVQSDVSLQLSEEDLQDFLINKSSPLQAYMQGRIVVTGDWSLLRSFADVFE